MNSEINLRALTETDIEKTLLRHNQKDIRDYINKNAEFAIYIGDINERGKGYSYNTAYKTIKFVFH